MYLKKLIKILKQRKLSVATVESCSSGYLSYLLTKIPGSSQVFKGGVIAYSLETKNTFFKIPLPILKKTQGVSAQIALLLAKKIRKILKSDIGAAIVGFAGPTTKKGTKKGTVFISVADKKGNQTKKVIIPGSRDTVRKEASRLTINLIYNRVNK